MEISMGILIKILSEKISLHTNLNVKEDFKLSGYQVGLPADETEKRPAEQLYVLSRDEVAEAYPSKVPQLVFCRDPMEFPVTEKRFCWICPEQPLTAIQACMYLQEAWNYYFHFCSRLQKMIIMKNPLDEILSLAEGMFGVRSGISTRSMTMIGVSESFGKENQWVENRTGAALSEVNELAMDQDFQNAVELEDVFYYYNIEQEQYYCYNFKVAGVYQARLVAHMPGHNLDYGLRQIVHVLGKAIDDIYEDYIYRGTASEADEKLRSLVIEILGGKRIRPGELRSLFPRWNWSENDDYQVVLFRFMEGIGEQIGLTYYPPQVRKIFPECYVLDVDRQLVCIRNITRGGDRKEEYRSRLPFFLRETLCRAGFSDIFHGFAYLHEHFLEAEQALLVGEQQSPTDWTYYFSDYRLSYLLDQCTRQLHTEQVIHSAILQIRTYDTENDTHLEETLELYLREQQNIARTARILGVHRTTLLVRLDRIRQISGIELEDPDTCLHLLLSFALLREEKKRNG